MSVQLTFTDPNFGESSIEVYRSTSTIDPQNLPTALASLPPDSKKYIDTTAVDGTTYYYRVSAIVNGVEKVSDEVSILADTPTLDELFVSNDGIWFDPSDLSTLFTDDAATTNVTTDGQAVAVMHDKSGNANHGTQTIAAKRPIYRTDGTYHWLEFDGTQHLNIAQTSWGAGLTIAVGEKSAFENQSKGCFFDCATDDGFASSYGFRFDKRGGFLRLGISVDGTGEFTQYELLTTSKTVLRAAYDQTDRYLWVNGSNVITETVSGETGPIAYTGTVTKLGAFWSEDPLFSYFGNMYSFVMVPRFCTPSEMELIDDFIDFKTDGTLVA